MRRPVETAVIEATRGHMSRKVETWAGVAPLPEALEASLGAELAQLHRVMLPWSPFENLGLWSPVASCQAVVGLGQDGCWYLVNTEGYDYARYAARLSGDPRAASKEAPDANR